MSTLKIIFENMLWMLIITRHSASVSTHYIILTLKAFKTTGADDMLILFCMLREIKTRHFM